jgi:hypothetical protein
LPTFLTAFLTAAAGRPVFFDSYPTSYFCPPATRTRSCFRPRAVFCFAAASGRPDFPADRPVAVRADVPVATEPRRQCPSSACRKPGTALPPRPVAAGLAVRGDPLTAHDTPPVTGASRGRRDRRSTGTRNQSGCALATSWFARRRPAAEAFAPISSRTSRRRDAAD